MLFDGRFHLTGKSACRVRLFSTETTGHTSITRPPYIPATNQDGTLEFRRNMRVKPPVIDA